jgi:RNA polymerase sigma-70 factor (ECF subfamily)
VVDVLRFESFYEREYPGVRRALAVALGEVGAAEDAAQEAFVKAWLRWGRVGGMVDPAGWVYVVAVRYARRRARVRDKRGREAMASRDPRDVATGVVERVSGAEALASLTERQRLAVVLRYYSDLPLNAIAEAMGCTVGTVKSTLHAALSRLRVDLTDAEEVTFGGCS